MQSKKDAKWRGLKDNDYDEFSKEMLHYVNLLSVSDRVVFVRDERNGTFQAKLHVKNLSPRFVSFVVRSSSVNKFSIKPRYGYIQPRKPLEIVLSTTKHVKEFLDISQDFFGIFAVPIYDKRQLNNDKIRLLWGVHGTNLFPYESSEFHKIPYVIPASDLYYSNLSILHRISKMNLIIRPRQPALVQPDELVDKETFSLNWPGKFSQDDDQALEKEKILADWYDLAHKVRIQTNSAIQNTKTLIGMIVFGALGCAFTGSMYFSQSGIVRYLFNFTLQNVKDAELEQREKTGVFGGWFS